MTTRPAAGQVVERELAPRSTCHRKRRRWHGATALAGRAACAMEGRSCTMADESLLTAFDEIVADLGLTERDLLAEHDGDGSARCCRHAVAMSRRAPRTSTWPA